MNTKGLIQITYLGLWLNTVQLRYLLVALGDGGSEVQPPMIPHQTAPPIEIAPYKPDNGNITKEDIRKQHLEPTSEPNIDPMTGVESNDNDGKEFGADYQGNNLHISLNICCVSNSPV